MTTKLETVPPATPLDDLLPIFDAGRVAIVADGGGFHGLITRVDVLNYLRRRRRCLKRMRVDDDEHRPVYFDARPHLFTPVTFHHPPMTPTPAARPTFATRAIHAGQSPDPTTGAVMTPIYATSTYAQQSPGVHKGFDYGRSHNPTRFAFERCVADLEEGTAGFAFASGLAAIATVLELLDHGSHVLVCDDIYGGTYRLFERVRRRSANLDFSYVDPTNLEAFAAAIRPTRG